MPRKKIATNNKERRVRDLTTETGSRAEEVQVAARRAAVRNTEANGSSTPSIPTISETLKARFKEDDQVNALLKDRATKQAKEARPIAVSVAAKFEKFKPSRLTDAQREAYNFLEDRKDFNKVLAKVAEKSGEQLQSGTDNRALTLNLKGTEALIDRTTPPDGNGNVLGTVAIPALFNAMFLKLATPPTLRDDPAVTICKASEAAEKAVLEIEGKLAESPAPSDTTLIVAAETESVQSSEFVRKQVDGLMHTVGSPEEQLQVNVERRATQKDIELDTFKFQLREGASDVTSYHDFNSLQIAFDNVWEEILDDRLGASGRELYFTYNQVLKDYGIDDTNRRAVTSVEDLRNLLADIRTFLGTTVKPSPAPHNSLLDSLSRNIDLISDTATLNPTLDVGVIGKPARDSKAYLDEYRSRLTTSTTTAPGTALTNDGATRLSHLLSQIDRLLATEYAFTVFAPDSVNFGIMVTYRQTWKPESYQVGDLVSTIPLAPREVRRYTTKRISKKTRAVKEIEENVRTTRTGADDTSRAEREIVARAENKTNFNLTANQSYGTDDGFKIGATQQGGGDQAQLSADTKKQFREAVLKSAQEYRQQNRMEIDTTATEETEDTTFHEIQNPNDELTVTYLFYELQRTYRISEKIHRVTPVVLVANEVPRPDEIDDAWLMRFDWILRRVLLDDSFRPALEYLTESFAGAEINIHILEGNAKAQKQVVDEIKAQLTTQMSTLDASLRNLGAKQDAQAGLQFAEGILGTVKNVFDPFGLTGRQVLGTESGAQAVVDFAQEGVDRAEREKSRLLDQLGVATTALQIAVDKLSAAVKEHYDRVTEIDRLRIHVKENILHYMQAIWDHEPPDQRYFRVFDTKVPILTPDISGRTAPATSSVSEYERLFMNGQTMRVELPRLATTLEWKSLVEVADLDQVLGYKGNYAIYRLKENNYLTLHMMQNYIELSDEVQLRDPDDFANYTVEQLRALAECLYKRNKNKFTEAQRAEIKKLIIDRLTSGRAEDDRVIVPTNSLYIEALVGTHPLLEDFKLAHRVLDVKKVQAEVRRAELENVRLAARALEGEREDPDIEKKIVVQGIEAGVTIQPNPE